MQDFLGLLSIKSFSYVGADSTNNPNPYHLQLARIQASEPEPIIQASEPESDESKSTKSKRPCFCVHHKKKSYGVVTVVLFIITVVATIVPSISEWNCDVVVDTTVLVPDNTTLEKKLANMTFAEAHRIISISFGAQVIENITLAESLANNSLAVKVSHFTVTVSRSASSKVITPK
ncbi:MAG: hypothetical protein A6F71_10460 [Cycloclasticus sp. symbiont of Poecilosclerida sp. M]|nr:MAG: hypothetical protein A6F71_10460 [Cycloclasticus sp. symbiont of Poecilosclerida sp. M]